MTEQHLESGVAKVIGPSISAAVGAVLTWLTAGSTGVSAPGLAALLTSLGGICGLVVSLMYRRYVGVLAAGAKGKTSPERQAYDRLRESLAGGNMAARLYARRLTGFLDGIDRFFGDAGMANRTLFPRAFGLKTPAPLWTVPAFDRCLLPALIYPVATIFVIWAVSGRVGPAEAALGLGPLSAWKRCVAVMAFGFLTFTTWRALQTTGWKLVAWLALGSAGFVAVAVAVAGAGAGVAGVVAAVAFAVAGTGTGAVASAVASVVVDAFDLVVAVAIAATVAVVAAVVAGVILAAIPLIVAVAFVVAVIPFVIAMAVFTVVALLSDKAIEHRWQVVFLSLFLPAMIVACLAAAGLLSSLEIWRLLGPLLLFLGLLTLLNAPFDWASLGLTRALLRRGLELGGWWPYLLALVDALLAAGIVALLALVMVIGVQTFDGLAAHGGGKPVLPLDSFFDGIASHPAAPEYWWAYALLLSSMIPSFINLVIGGASLMRGVPGVPSVLLQFMPSGKAVPAFDRAWIALVLTFQVAVGAVLGIAAQALLAVGVIFYVMPRLGLGLLEMARDVAAFNLPLRAWQLFASIL